MECKPSFLNEFSQYVNSNITVESLANKLDLKNKNYTNEIDLLLNDYRLSSAVNNLYLQKKEQANSVNFKPYELLLDSNEARVRFLIFLKQTFYTPINVDLNYKYKIINHIYTPLKKSDLILLRKTTKSDLLFGIDWIYSAVESMYFYDYRNFFSPMVGLLFNEYSSTTHSFMWILAISTVNFQLF